MSLKKMRNDTGKSLREVGKEVGVAHTTISSWEKKGDEGSVPEKHAERLAESLGVGVSELPVEESPQRYAETENSAGKWIAHVMRSDEPVEVKTTLMAIGALFDEEHGLVSTTRQKIVDETGLVKDQIFDSWEAVLESPWIERVGDGRWTFRLRFADDD